MKKVLMVLAHPNMEESIANKTIVNHLSENLDHVEVRNLYKLYPQFDVNVELEQEKLVESDIVVFQFPWYWYSSPSLLKEYMDKVMSFNFAYGPLGNKLRGKEFMVSTTIGGPEDGYRPGGYNHYYVDDLLNPFQETALKTGMLWHKAVRSHQMIYVPDVYHTEEEVKLRALDHADELLTRLKSLQTFSEEGMIKDFVKEFFSMMDVHAENGYFVQHIAGYADFKFEQGHFKGHGGFIDWYENIRKVVKPGNEHILNTVEVVKTSEAMVYEVKINMTFKAETYDGGKINQEVNERWRVRLTTGKRIQIEEYIVL